MTTEQKAEQLRQWGFVVGPRDPRLCTAYHGGFMVVEASQKELDSGMWPLPTRNLHEGPWCIVGDDLDFLVEEAWKLFAEEYQRSDSQVRFQAMETKLLLEDTLRETVETALIGHAGFPGIAADAVLRAIRASFKVVAHD